MQQISAEELHRRLLDGWKPVILDVREDWETEICGLENSLHISLSGLPQRLAELNQDDEFVVLCHHGMRSMQAVSFMEHHGFNRIVNLDGGIHAWADSIDPTMAKY